MLPATKVAPSGQELSSLAGLGILIKGLRQERGLTQGQLATYARVSRSWLSRLEIDDIQQPDHDMLRRVAVVLGVPDETLLSAAGYGVATIPRPREREPEEILLELESALRRREAQRVHPLRIPIIRRSAPIDAEVDAGIVIGEKPEPAGIDGGAAMSQDRDLGEAYYVPMPGAENHKYIAIWVESDLEPYVRPGATAIVDQSADCQMGDLCLVEYDGRWLFRYAVERDGARWLVDVPERQALRLEDARMLGVVVAIYKAPKRRS